MAQDTLDVQVDFSGLARPVIDCDIHNELQGHDMLYPYLDDHWVAYLSESGFDGPNANDYPLTAPTSARAGTKPEIGRAGSRLDLVQTQVLDPWDVEIGILTCNYRIQSVFNDDLAVSLATAINQWQVDHWLEQDSRLRGSLVVPSQNPILAAEEIERFGAHPGFVQVLVPVRSDAPYGKRFYDPMFKAAEKYNLVVGIDFGGAPGIPPSAAGWPSTYIEEYTDMSQVFQSQVASLVVDGAFARFPDLRVSLIEGGFTWLPAWMWRLDKEWKGLRREIPWVKEAPSEYVKQHVRMTLQPLDAPPDSEQLLQVIDQLQSDDMLMFATDYPHWHFDSAQEAIPQGLSESLLEKILRGNARAWYRL